MQRVAGFCLLIGFGLWVVGFLAYGFGENMPVEWQSQERAFGVVAVIVLAALSGAVFVAIGLLLTAIAVVRRALTRR